MSKGTEISKKQFLKRYRILIIRIMCTYCLIGISMFLLTLIFRLNILFFIMSLVIFTVITSYYLGVSKGIKDSFLKTDFVSHKFKVK